MHEYLLETVTGKTYRFKLNEDVFTYFNDVKHDSSHEWLFRVVCDDGMERTFVVSNIVCIQRNK